MSSTIYTVITGTGSYIPKRRVTNEDFLSNEFYDSDGKKINKPNTEIMERFLEITTIAERRYVTDDLMTSDIACLAALEAIEASGIDKEELDYVIVAHNFGDIAHGSNRTDIIPSLASRVKHKLEIENPNTVAYDLVFGCPGWLQGMIQADYFIKSGDAKKVLVIGAEVLSRVIDLHDRDCMLYADGAGATILEARESNQPVGIRAHTTRSDTFLHSHLLHMGKSFHEGFEKQDDMFLKMNGRKLYQYALETVPQAIKNCLEKSKTDIRDIKTILIHQANGKMDDAIVKRLYALYDMDDVPAHVMPMTIDTLGNSSVASIPTLLDLIIRNKLDGLTLSSGDKVILASVGAGMNINAMMYQMV